MDDIDLQNESHRTIGFGIFLALVVAMGLIFWIWGLISKGTLLIYGTPPFTVSFYKGLDYKCDTSPCKIKESSGIKNIVIYKDEYKTLTQQIDIKRWSTTEIQLEKFQLEPKMVEVDAMPQIEKKIVYKMSVDENNGMQKLVQVDAFGEKAIVYFPGSIKMPIIFGSKNAVLILDKGSSDTPAYKVNVLTKERQVINLGSMKDIKDGVWSFSGKYFVFSTKNSSNLWLLDDNNRIKKVDLEIDLGQLAWTYKDSLLFVTYQVLTDNSVVGKYGKNYVDVMPTNPESTYYSFGEYHPEENTYTKIDIDTAIKNKPSNLIPVGSGNEIYFEAEAKKYKLIIK